MNCGTFRDGLMDYLGGAKPPSALAHEQACADCAGLLSDIRTQADLIARLPRPAAPPGLGDRIERALDARRAAAVSRRWSGWAAVAAAAAVFAMALLPLHRDPPAPPAHRSVRVVDIELPDRGTLLGRFAPNYENPTASPLDPLVANEQR